MSGASSSRQSFLPRALSLFSALVFSALAVAQPVNTFAGNAQHTGVYAASAKNLNKIHAVLPNDLNTSGAFAHYGMPLVSANNSFFLPVKTATDGFEIDAFPTIGNAYVLTSDYRLPSHNWIPVYQPVLTVNGTGTTRLYWAGAGGTLYCVDSPDNTAAMSLTFRRCFYTSFANYQANQAAYDNSVFINTPITADSQGNIFFGFRIENSPFTPFTSNQGGFVRMTPSGTATYVFAGDITADGVVFRDSHNAAPALSNDEQTLYVECKGSDAYHSYLVALDANTLAVKSKVFLLDPRNGNPAGVLDDSTASPMVAPDGDVFLGTFANPYDGSRGFLLHFSGDLSVQYTAGGFGWDYTPGIVPASMVPSYTGPSSYLLFCKYNNYNINDGNGVNTVAILDPNSTQINDHPSASGLVEMREVMKVIGPTPDSEYPGTFAAVREWCINAPCVNPSTNSVFFDSEDGHLYRWNLVTDTLSQAITLSAGFGAPYIPTTIGPDGTIYTLNGGQMFSIGHEDGNVSFTITSSEPDTRVAVVGDNITFTAHVDPGVLGTPTGSFTFTDLTYDGLNPVSTTVASNVAVDASGNASVTTNALNAGGTFLGNHFITASYSGDPAPGDITMVQKIHAFSSSTSVTSSSPTASFGSAVLFDVSVSSTGGTPTGFVTLRDGSNVIGQVAVDGTGVAHFGPFSNFTVGVHNINAFYNSDTQFASSSGSVSQTIQSGTTTALVNLPNPSTFGQNVALTASVSAAIAGAGTPTGSITFNETGHTLGTVALSGGNATLNVSNLSVGSHSIFAVYNPTPGWQGSTSPNVTQDVTDGTNMVVASSPNPSQLTQLVTITATVTAVDAGAGTPTGNVVFTIDGSSGASIPVNASGVASTATSSLARGSHTISATFTGTNGYGNSGGAAQNQIVNTPTATALASSLNPSVIGQNVTFTATVTGSGGTPTGTVTFKDGASTLGSSAVNGSGQATLSTNSLPVGNHSITASFVGTNNWLNSTSSALSQVVNADTTSPSIPLNVLATKGPLTGQITVTWSASTDPDDAVNHYEVWSAPAPKGTFTLLGSPTGTSIVDTPGHNIKRRYYVIAVDSHGNKSGQSAVVNGVGK